MPTSARPEPSYLRLPAGTLQARAERAVASLARCRICPRECDVDRLSDKWSACKTGRHAVVSSAFPHMGEEDCLRGRYGSGTIFFGHCNLRCVFCQNFDVSQGLPPGRRQAGLSAETIATMMLDLQHRGCHNINFVTPEHVVPQMLEALARAVAQGLHIPIVYNTSAYDSLESLRWLDGIVDIYMPDFKCWTPESSNRYLRAPDYPKVARTALREMHRQVGDLTCDAEGIAVRGILVRHLVMPQMLDETQAILKWLAHELGPRTYVNLMAQYRPHGRVSDTAYPELHRALSAAEYRRALAMAEELGLRLDGRSQLDLQPPTGRLGHP